MCEEDQDDEIMIEIGYTYKDKNGIYWVVNDVDGDMVSLYPEEDQEKVFTKQELFDEMEKT